MLQIAWSLVTFTLAMLLYPEVQTNAVKEMEFVLGFERLPEMGDQDDLPYVTAIVKEVLRYAVASRSSFLRSGPV